MYYYAFQDLKIAMLKRKHEIKRFHNVLHKTEKNAKYMFKWPI